MTNWPEGGNAPLDPPDETPFAESTETQLRQDRLLYGVSFVKDGKRVDPNDIEPTR
jgi:hypothetical protein